MCSQRWGLEKWSLMPMFPKVKKNVSLPVIPACTSTKPNPPHEKRWWKYSEHADRTTLWHLCSLESITERNMTSGWELSISSNIFVNPVKNLLSYFIFLAIFYLEQWISSLFSKRSYCLNRNVWSNLSYGFGTYGNINLKSEI